MLLFKANIRETDDLLGISDTQQLLGRTGSREVQWKGTFIAVALDHGRGLTGAPGFHARSHDHCPGPFLRASRRLQFSAWNIQFTLPSSAFGGWEKRGDPFHAQHLCQSTSPHLAGPLGRRHTVTDSGCQGVHSIGNFMTGWCEPYSLQRSLEEEPSTGSPRCFSHLLGQSPWTSRDPVRSCLRPDSASPRQATHAQRILPHPLPAGGKKFISY